jgi:Beta-lactamase enzyme family
MAGSQRRGAARWLVVVVTCGTVAATGAGLISTASAARAQETGLAARASRICTSAKHPKIAARLSREIIDALRGRDSAVGLTVADAKLDLTCKLHQRRHFDAASVIKVTIISALLLKVGGFRHLTRSQRSLAWRMITRSDNAAATALWNQVGLRGMQRFLDRARMRQTRLSPAWGLCQLTAHDELTLLKLLSHRGKVLSTASRRYVLSLMVHVIPPQRWGVSAGAPSDVTVHIKNGWLPYPDSADWHINSIGAFTGRGIRYQIAALTSGDPSMAYGIETIQRAARVINEHLAR